MYDPVETFCRYISESGLKNTPQRRRIVKIFFRSGKHLSTEELYEQVKAEENGIGQATVYRTLKLLCEAGLAKEQHFGETTARYEPIEDDSHHDHLICTMCGKNIEVMDEEIEQRQEELAKNCGFILTSHRMVMYGLCGDCQKREKD